MSSSRTDFLWLCRFIVYINNFSENMSPCQVEMSSNVCTRTFFFFFCLYRDHKSREHVNSFLCFSTEALFWILQLYCLTAHKWQIWKRVFLSCYCHEIYKIEAVGLKNYNYTWKITIFAKMWNLGQFLEKSIFCQ